MVTSRSSKQPPEESRPRRRPPASTPEARENQMIALAVDLAEKQIIAGTASSQVITHYLKLATTREKLEQEKLSRENELLRAKSESVQSAQRTEEMMGRALQAFKSYKGEDDDDDAY